MGTRNIQNIICATTFQEHSTYPNSVLPISKQKKKKEKKDGETIYLETRYIYARVCILVLDRSVAGTKSVYKSRGICASKPNGKNETKQRKQKRREKRKESNTSKHAYNIGTRVTQ